MNQVEFDRAFNKLTSRRKEVLRQILAGESDRAIAQSLDIDQTTVRKYVERICHAFNLEKGQGEERSYKRDRLVVLVGRHKPEMLQERSPAHNFYTVTEEAALSLPADESEASERLREMSPEARQSMLEGLKRNVTEEREKRRAAKILNKLGSENYLKGNFQQAADYLQWAIAFDFTFGKAHYNLGSTYEELQQPERAIEQYIQATQCRESVADDAANNLARLEILSGNYAGAIARLLASLQRVKDAKVKSNLHKNLGWAYFQQLQYEKAESHLQEAIKFNCFFAAAYYLLAQVQNANGDSQSARLSWQQALSYHLKNEDSAPWKLPELEVWRLEARRQLQGTNE